MPGEQPWIQSDVYISAIFLALYAIGAIWNTMIFHLNRRRGHKFFMSWAMSSFCVARTLTFIFRIIWANQLNNVHIIIAAQIFSAAGILVAYLVVVILSLRLFRAIHPNLGWNQILNAGLTIAYGVLFVSFFLAIAFIVVSYYTLDSNYRAITLWVQRVTILYMLVFNLGSLVFLLLCLLLPQRSASDNFGEGSIKSKSIIVGVMVFFCIFIVGFRFGTVWSQPRPASHVAWYQSKPAYYIILFGLELPIIYGLLVTRFDQMFWVPDGSSKPGDYGSIRIERGAEGSLESVVSEVDIAQKDG